MIRHIACRRSWPAFEKKLLFVLSCGGLVEHALRKVRDASDDFTAVFAFGAPMLDIGRISRHFASTILDYHIFGQETLWKAFERTAKPEVMHHTSVYLGEGGKVHRMRVASVRHRPNGEDARCCDQPAKYQRRHRDGRCIYRCLQAHHPKGRPRTFYVRLEEGTSKDGGCRSIGGRGQLRCIIELCDSNR
ncbi:hypothetical protein OH77DRAFT_161250 [Trametes cingulata]|nr:hypothetical protein OH77DRAFT_161250 [Trametes cingulata]